MFRIRAATHGGSSSGALRSRRPAFWSLTLPLLLALTLPGEAHPQSGTGALSGSVAVAGSGEPLAAAEVSIQGGTASTTTDARGRFLLPALPAGSHLVQVRRLGHEEAQQTVTIRAGETTSVRFLLAISAVDVEGVVISATRGSRDAMATAASVGVVEGSSIREARPAHPSEIMGRIPGVWVNVTGGEGHMTAIRQPLGTQPVYLFLEDGVPTRSTGFFNHNALYEVNVPQADRIEVLKGPGTALHGSDAIGGVLSGSLGIQGHYANGLAALFIACGQDAACVAEAAVGVTRFEKRGQSLYAAVTLPNLIVGTVGGGTGLPSQRACLQLMGLAGSGHARAFAEVCAGVALAGELSIIAALASGRFTRAHEILARRRKPRNRFP